MSSFVFVVSDGVILRISWNDPAFLADDRHDVDAITKRCLCLVRGGRGRREGEAFRPLLAT